MTTLVREYPTVVRDIAEHVRSLPHCTVSGSGSRSRFLPAARSDAQQVVAPAGILRIDAGEMVVECHAGTSVSDVQAALAEVGQRLNFPDGGSVGGVLATSHNSVHRLGRGAVRDSVLRLDVVGADGVAYRCGGNTVKNVSGFDVCRLHVGAFGTLGVIATVLLRTMPLPRAARWLFTSHAIASQLVGRQWGVTSILSDGDGAFVHCEGHESDLALIQERHALSDAEAPPQLGDHRWSVAPYAIGQYLSPGVFGEIGVGVVHSPERRGARHVDDAVRSLNSRIRDAFDPGRVFNSHLDVLEVAQ